MFSRKVEESKAAGRADNYDNLKGKGAQGDDSWKGGGEREGRGGSITRQNLRGDLDAQQLNTFTRWWNSWLIHANVKVKDLTEEIRPGVISIKLLEQLSDSSCGKYSKKPVGKFQQLENHNLFLNQLKAKQIKLVNIGAEDLWSGDRKLVLGLTWTLILRYEIHQFGMRCPTRVAHALPDVTCALPTSLIPPTPCAPPRRPRAVWQVATRLSCSSVLRA